MMSIYLLNMLNLRDVIASLRLLLRHAAPLCLLAVDTPFQNVSLVKEDDKLVSNHLVTT